MLKVPDAGVEPAQDPPYESGALPVELTRHVFKSRKIEFGLCYWK